AGRHRRTAAAPARTAAGQREPPARVCDLAGAGAPTGAARPCDRERTAGEHSQLSAEAGRHGGGAGKEPATAAGGARGRVPGTRHAAAVVGDRPGPAHRQGAASAGAGRPEPAAARADDRRTVQQVTSAETSPCPLPGPPRRNTACSGKAFRNRSAWPLIPTP